MKRVIEVSGRFIGEGVVQEINGGMLFILSPQKGKTRIIVRRRVQQSRRGDLIIYSTRTHAEACSVIKHYIEAQRESGWSYDVLLIHFAGKKRYCPFYPKVIEWIKEGKEKGEDRTYTQYCRKICQLFRETPAIKEEMLFEKRKRGRPSKAVAVSPVAAKIRIIMPYFSYRLYKKIYGELPWLERSTVLIIHHNKEELEELAKEGYRTMYGCIRAFLFRRRIERGDDEKLKNILSYPTLLVIPHHLLPVMLNLGNAYAARIYLVIDEADSLLNIKIRRDVAKRAFNYNKKATEMWWKQKIERYLLESAETKFEDDYANIIVPLPQLEKERNPETGKLKAKEVYLIDVVDYKLEKVKEKGKLAALVVVSASIPVLPLSLCYAFVDWVKKFFPDEISLYYNYIDDLPEHKIIFSLSPDTILLKHINLVITGSKRTAARIVKDILVKKARQVMRVTFQRPVDDYNVFRKWCEKQIGKKYDGVIEACVIDEDKHVYLFPSYIVEIKGSDEVVRGFDLYKVKVVGDAIKIRKNMVVTWLGGRWTRGITWSPWVRRVAVFTRGRVKDEEREVMRLRAQDVLQLIFRVNSRQDIDLYLDQGMHIVAKYVVKVFNTHVDKIISRVMET